VSCLFDVDTTRQEEDNERSVAISSALATFFKHYGYVNVKASHVLDRCPSFNARDKTKLLSKFSTKVAKKVGVHPSETNN